MKLWKCVLLNKEFERTCWSYLGVSRKEVILDMQGDKADKLFKAFLYLLEVADFSMIQLLNMIPQHYREQVEEYTLEGILNLDIKEEDYKCFLPEIIK